MKNNDFTTTIFVDETPEAVFNAINNVRGWWSENITGRTDKLNGAFDYHYLDVHRCKIGIIELVPAKKVAWHVLDNYFNFTKDAKEWKDTKIVFEISRKDGKTALQFTHQGLTPKYECYPVCDEAWTHYIQDSLCGLITSGEGQPTAKDEYDSFNDGLLEDLQNERQ